MNELNVIATARYLNADSIDHVVTEWKMSNDEANALKMLIGFRDSEANYFSVKTLVHMVAIGKLTKEEAHLVLKFHGDHAKLVEWDKVEFPEFPVNGDDLLKLGFKPSKELGDKLNFLKNQWATFNYRVTKEELLRMASNSVGDTNGN